MDRQRRRRFPLGRRVGSEDVGIGRFGAFVALVGLLVTGACGGADDQGGDRADRQSTTSTTRLEPSTTTTSPGPPPSQLGPAPPVPAGAPVVTGDDAVLAPPGAGTVRPVAWSAGRPCADLGTAGAEITCGTTGELAWVVESPPGGNPARRVTVYRFEGDQAVPALEAVDQNGDLFRHAHVAVADLDGQGGAELVVGFRAGGTGGALELDVVAAPGQVVAHRSIEKGRAQLGAGGVQTWAARYAPEDPNCCPSAWLAEVMVYDGAEWRIAFSAPIGADAVFDGVFP